MDKEGKARDYYPLRAVFVNNLKYFRSLKNMSQEALSSAINKSSTYINGVENKGTFPKLEVIELICDVLAIEPYQLFLPFGSPQNIKKFDRDNFMKELTDKLHERLKKDIHWEVQDVLGKEDL